MKKKSRLDLLACKKYPQFSLKQIQSWILQGKVTVDDRVITKAGTPFPENVNIKISNEKPKYVSRGGFKLEKALDYFKVDVKDKVVLDAGISTGGFADCLLQRGVKKLYGIDVGYGQVHEKIYNDERVKILERTNLRYLTSDKLGEKVDLVTLDLSFISLLKVMEAVNNLLKDKGELITLIKPQFEAEKKDVGKKGIIKSSDIHQKVVSRIVEGIKKYGFKLVGVIESPILGAYGNKEFLAYFIK